LRGDAVPAFVFCPRLPETGGRGTLEDDERHHVVNVCRARPGDTATASDGAGWRAMIRLLEVGRVVTFEVERVERVQRMRNATIACGAPEGSRADWLVEKLAEFGIDRFQPLDCERGGWRWSTSRAARLDRVALAAMKQSQQAYRMRIERPLRLEAWARTVDPGTTRWLADTAGGVAGAPVGSFAAACGPAGGLTDAERAILTGAGFTPVRLAEGILRAETAGVALAAHWAGADPSVPQGRRRQGAAGDPHDPGGGPTVA